MSYKVEFDPELLIGLSTELKEEAEERLAEIAYQSAKATSAFVDRTGKLRRSIKKRKSKVDKGWLVMATAPHSHLIELGHDIVKKGKRVGIVEARPFLRPAIEHVKSQVGNVTKSFLQFLKPRGRFFVRSPFMAQAAYVDDVIERLG